MYKPTEYQDQIYFCTKEYNLSLWQQASEIITNPSYTPFKRKITKKFRVLFVILLIPIIYLNY